VTALDIDLVLFDLDDVLVDYDREVRCRRLGERIDRDADSVHRALFASGLETEADLGRIDAETQARALGASLGTQVSLADCIDARAASMRPRLAMLAMVESLSARCALAILTNNGFLVRDHFERLCPPFAPFFADRVHCSAMYGLSKPDPEIFLRCAASLGVAPSRTLFIDDRPENIVGAERAGMLGHHYRDAPTLRARLFDFGLLEPTAHAS